MRKKKRKWLKWVILLLIVAAVIGARFLRGSSNVNYTEETAKTQDILTYYAFSGNVEPDGFKTIYATENGTVRDWLYQEGDTVREDANVLRCKNGSSIKSSIAGTISNIYVKKDNSFTAGEALFRVADYAHPIIRVKVDEYDVSALHKGDEVAIKVQASGAMLTGTIRRIAQEATISNDIAYYEVEIDVPQDGTLSMGLTCELSVLRQSTYNATTISIKAVQYDTEGKPYVFMRDHNDQLITQPITVGINNGMIVEVVSGLKSGETVLIPPAGMSELIQQMMSARRR